MNKKTHFPHFPVSRPRRLRITPEMRNIVRETEINANDFIYPIFVRPGKGIQSEIVSMPGIYQWSVDKLPAEVEDIARLGIKSVILFGIPPEKDRLGSDNFSSDGIIQQSVRAIKSAVPEMIVISDICMCEYTQHGHCGVLNVGESRPQPNQVEGYLLNDETLEILAKAAVSHAEAGADIVAPSGMIDGMVKTIRTALDEARFEHIAILSYAVKYASAFYGPFRDAAESPPKFGDRKSHQMDPANVREALRECALDVREGADMLMVKPALPYLDVIYRVHSQFPQLPLGAYNVSGEYSMLKAASIRGWLDERQVVLETLTAIRRAGADIILTYHAKDAAKWLAEI